MNRTREGHAYCLDCQAPVDDSFVMGLQVQCPCGNDFEMSPPAAAEPEPEVTYLQDNHGEVRYWTAQTDWLSAGDGAGWEMYSLRYYPPRPSLDISMHDWAQRCESLWGNGYSALARQGGPESPSGFLDMVEDYKREMQSAVVNDKLTQVTLEASYDQAQTQA